MFAADSTPVRFSDRRCTDELSTISAPMDFDGARKNGRLMAATPTFEFAAPGGRQRWQIQRGFQDGLWDNSPKVQAFLL